MEPMEGVVVAAAAAAADDHYHESILIPGLPRPIAQCILARLPRRCHRTLHRVSRAWHEALRPASIYLVRAMEGVREPWLYATFQLEGPFYAFDPSSAEWSPLPAIPVDPMFTFTDKECFVAGRQLLVVGSHLALTGIPGRSSAIEPIIWSYSLDDPTAWRVAPPMRSARCLFASASAPGSAFVAGGVAFGTRRPLRSAEALLPGGAGWVPLPDMIRARKECSGFSLGGRFFVVGGSDDRDEPVTAGECYDPDRRQWSPVPGLWPESSIARLQGGTLAPPLVAVAAGHVYAWDHPNGLLKRWEWRRWSGDEAAGEWVVMGAAPPGGRRPNPQSRGWGLGFKSVGDELWLIGGSDPDVPFIDACRPDAATGAVAWRRVARTVGGQAFVYNCAVMGA